MKIERSTGASSFTRSSIPSKAYGSQASLQLSSASATAYLWFSLSGIPDNAIITSATLTVRQNGAWPSVNRTLTLRAVKTWTYAKLRNSAKPAAFGAAATVQRAGATASRTPWSFDVTALVQAMLLPGQSRGYFSIASSEATIRQVFGFKAPSSRPTLSVTYEVATPAPTGLAPTGGAVSIRNPPVSWQPVAGQTQSRLQVSTEEDFSAIVYDSQLQANTLPQWDLAATAYQLPLDGSWVYVRAAVVGPAGLSDWGPAAEVRYVPLVTVAVTDPPAIALDSSPTIAWDVAGGVQRSYRARITQGGADRWSSGFVTSDAEATTPAAGVDRVGATGAAVVEVVDDVVRVLAPGAPVVATGTKPFTYQPGAGDGEVTDLEVTTGINTPWAPITWRRSEIPDEWGIERDGALIARFDGLDVEPDTHGIYRHVDYAASPFTRHRYRVLPITNRQIPADGPVADVVPAVRGLWLCDPATGEDLVLLGRDEPEPSFNDPVSTSSPLDVAEDYVRQGAPRLPTWALAGTLQTALGRDVEDSHALLTRWREDPRLLRVSFGALNFPAICHSVQINTVRAGVSESTKRWSVKLVAVQQRERTP